MVFGVWVLRKQEKLEHNKIKNFAEDLIISAKTMGLNEDFNEILKKVELEKQINKGDLLNYYKSLNYDFNGDHQRGLNLYESYLKKWDLI